MRTEPRRILDPARRWALRELKVRPGLLDGDALVTSLDPIDATRADLYLARDLLTFKSWLLDYDVGI